MKGLRGLLVALLSIGSAFLFQPQQALAQGTVSGHVVVLAGQQAVPLATVYIAGTKIEAQTDAAGSYVLHDVPAGPVVVMVRVIGYRPETRTIDVKAGTTATANFEMAPQTVVLDEIIVTGTAGGTQRRALGNDVARVSTREVLDKAQSTDVQALLSGRAAGVQVQLSNGEAGGGNQIKIRGISSLSLNNGPLLYVDGIRVNNQSGGSSASRDARSASRMNDFNPEDIESIEVIKGPAAATLYGTEASAGVIQIITKRGKAGATAFEAEMQAGYNVLQDAEGKIDWNYFRNPTTGALEKWHAVITERERGYPEWLQFGPLQHYQMNLHGGQDRLRYYVSGNYGYQEGYVDWNTFRDGGLRANLDANLLNNLDMAVSTNWVNQNRRSATAPSPYTLAGSWPFGHPERLQTRGWYAATPEQERQIENRSLVDRNTISVQFNHTPLKWFKQRLTLGRDKTNELNTIIFPALPATDPVFGTLSLGDKRQENRRITYESFDYSGTARFNTFASLVSATSAGFQYNKTVNDSDNERGQNFAAPGLTALDAAATTSATGTWVKNASVGLYLQELLEWRNRVFFTAAVRGDDNSAFGANYKAALYPKFSATWVMNEESFWHVPVLNTFRLRAAWGKAGRQPDTFAAATFYNASPGPGGNPALLPGALGNPDLGPEVGTELEAGFDAGLFNDRIKFGFTFYDKKTRDALVQVPSAPSTGYTGSQWQNLGLISNRGTESSIDAMVFEAGPVRWDFGFNMGTNRNRILDLGGVNLGQTGFSRNMVGYPIGAVWGSYVVSAEWSGDPDPRKGGRPINAMCRNAQGGVQPCAATGDADVIYSGRSGDPTFFGGVSNTVTLFRNLRLFGNVEFKGGHESVNTQLGSAHNVMGNTLGVNGDPNNGISPDPVIYFYTYNTNAAFSGSNVRSLGQFPAGFARIRELSATYTFPGSLSRFVAGAKRASLSVAGHNLWFIWKETKSYYGRLPGDLEGGSFGSQNIGTGGTVFFYPQTTFTATLRVTF